MNTIILKETHAELIINSPKYGIKTVLIDLDDVNKIKKFKWYLEFSKDINNFYIQTSIWKPKRKSLRLHRYLMNPQKGFVIDHINHNTLDNRKCNLRICTNKTNMENRQKCNKNNSYSKVRGVHFDKKRNKYFSRIIHNGKNIYGGYFQTIKEAEKSVIELRKKYFEIDEGKKNEKITKTI